MRREMSAKTVTRSRRVYKTVTVTKQVMQCERPYVLFGEAVKQARHDLDWTQQELADKLGYQRASIANIETGRQRILLDDLFKFAKALKIKPLELFHAVAR